MSSFIGTKPNQVPTNGDLGRLAFLDYVGVDDVGSSVPTIPSANSISISTQISFVSGTSIISNINPPVTFINGGQITIIPTGKFTINATGNVSIAISAEIGKPLYLTYVVSNDIGKWYPSYSNTLNRLNVTAPATGSTLTILDSKVLTVNNTITLAGNDSKTLTVNNSVTLAADADGRSLTLGASLTLRTTDSTAAIISFLPGGGTIPYTVSPTFTSATAAAALTATSSFSTPVAISTTGNVNVGGDIVATGNITAYSLSDKRLKENITPIVNPIEKLMALSGNTFKWDSEFYAKQDQSLFKEYDVGVVAQEVQSVLPEAVNERDNGLLAVDYLKLIPLLIECIKVQQHEINELKGSK